MMHKHGDCVQCEDNERQQQEWAQRIIELVGNIEKPLKFSFVAGRMEIRQDPELLFLLDLATRFKKIAKEMKE